MNDTRHTVASPGISQIRPSSHTVTATPPPASAPPTKGVVDDSIALIEDGEDAATLHKKISAFGVQTQSKKHEWHRQPVATGKGPVRVKTFHAKLSDQGLEFLDDS